MAEKIIIHGMDKAMHNLQEIANIQPEIENLTLEAVIYVHSQMPEYPPAPADSSYRRTLTLFRTLTTLMGSYPDASSRVESLSDRVVGLVGTTLEYAPYVIDETLQTAVHKGNGWWVLQDVVLGSEAGIRAIYQHGIDSFIIRSSK